LNAEQPKITKTYRRGNTGEEQNLNRDDTDGNRVIGTSGDRVIGKSEKQDAGSRTQKGMGAHTSERKTYCFAVQRCGYARCSLHDDESSKSGKKGWQKRPLYQKKFIRVSAGLVVWTPVSDKQ
jgi:hypothetical protein